MSNKKTSDDQIQLIILGEEHEEPVDKRKAAWDAEMAHLKTRNWYFGWLHLFTGVSGFVLGKNVGNMQAFKIPLSTTEITNWDLTNLQVDMVITTAYELEFVVWASMFAFMSSAAHFIILWDWDNYEAGIKKGINRYRWWEYAISSSLMICQICMLFGVYDVVSLFFIGATNGACNLFGDIMELRNAGKKPKDVDWTPFYYGAFLGGWAWFVMFTFMLGSPGSSEAPWFVWVILAEYIIGFASFPYTMWSQYSQRGRFNNDLYPDLDNGGYIQGEHRYGTLSLVSKTLLVWLVIGGANQPSSYTGVTT